MPKHKINQVEFYITNVCNLACPGCNRFNNYKFRGYQKWADYAEVYQRWADELKIGSISILGGEPLLNPDILDWITGVHQLWPSSSCNVVTNAFHLNKVDGLYDTILNRPNVRLEIGIHNKAHKPKIFNEIENFLTGPLEYQFNNDNKYREYMLISDANGVTIKVEYNWWFHQGSLIAQENGFTLHQSDPEKAHSNCHMSTCHHFIKGKLYKCGVVALLPEFAEQYNVHLSDSDRDLMLGYQPLTIDHSYESKELFIKNLPNVIDQCKFCPEVYHGDQIFALEKKELKV